MERVLLSILFSFFLLYFGLLINNRLLTHIGIGSTTVDEPSMEEMAQREVEPASESKIESLIKKGPIEEAGQGEKVEEERELEIDQKTAERAGSTWAGSAEEVGNQQAVGTDIPHRNNAES